MEKAVTNHTINGFLTNVSRRKCDSPEAELVQNHLDDKKKKLED